MRLKEKDGRLILERWSALRRGLFLAQTILNLEWSTVTPEILKILAQLLLALISSTIIHWWCKKSREILSQHHLCASFRNDSTHKSCETPRILRRGRPPRPSVRMRPERLPGEILVCERSSRQGRTTRHLRLEDATKHRSGSRPGHRLSAPRVQVQYHPLWHQTGEHLTRHRLRPEGLRLRTRKVVRQRREPNYHQHPRHPRLLGARVADQPSPNVEGGCVQLRNDPPGARQREKNCRPVVPFREVVLRGLGVQSDAKRGERPAKCGRR